MLGLDQCCYRRKGLLPSGISAPPWTADQAVWAMVMLEAWAQCCVMFARCLQDRCQNLSWYLWQSHISAHKHRFKKCIFCKIPIMLYINCIFSLNLHFAVWQKLGLSWSHDISLLHLPVYCGEEKNTYVVSRRWLEDSRFQVARLGCHYLSQLALVKTGPLVSGLLQPRDLLCNTVPIVNKTYRALKN